jgi:CBS domain-containing protein
MHVREIMSKDLACCTPDTTLPEVARLMVEHDCGAIPVVDDPKHKAPLGILTDRDIVCRAIAQGKDPCGMTAGDCMTAAVLAVHPDTDVQECERLMRQHQVRRVLVTDADGCCCGIIAQADIANCRPEDAGKVLQDVSL